MGLFERAKHVAREIAEENVRRLTGEGRLTAGGDDAARRLIVGLEHLRRELVLHLKESEERDASLHARLVALDAKAREWRENAAFALARDNDELAGAAGERADTLEREAGSVRTEAEAVAAERARLGAELESLDRRIEAERARRRGIDPPVYPHPPAAGPKTRQLPRPQRDPLEQAFDDLKKGAQRD